MIHLLLLELIKKSTMVNIDSLLLPLILLMVYLWRIVKKKKTNIILSLSSLYGNWWSIMCLIVKNTSIITKIEELPPLQSNGTLFYLFIMTFGFSLALHLIPLYFSEFRQKFIVFFTKKDLD